MPLRSGAADRGLARREQPCAACHAADETPESAGFDLLFRGVHLICESNEQAIERGCLVMDSMHTAVKQPPIL